MLEARLGLKYEHRFGQKYYLSQLRPEEVDRIKNAEAAPSLLQLVNAWLERMPILDKTAADKFWSGYRSRYQSSLADVERGNMETFDRSFFENAPAPANPSARAPQSSPVPPITTAVWPSRLNRSWMRDAAIMKCQ